MAEMVWPKRTVAEPECGQNVSKAYSKYVQVFMRTPKKWQNSQPVDSGH